MTDSQSKSSSDSPGEWETSAPSCRAVVAPFDSAHSDAWFRTRRPAPDCVQRWQADPLVLLRVRSRRQRRSFPKPSPRRGSSLPRSLFAGRERDSRPDTGTPILRPRQRPYRLARAAGEAADRRSAGEGPRARNAGSVLEALSPLTRRAARAGLSPLRSASRGEAMRAVRGRMGDLRSSAWTGACSGTSSPRTVRPSSRWTTRSPSR